MGYLLKIQYQIEKPCRATKQISHASCGCMGNPLMPNIGYTKTIYTLNLRVHGRSSYNRFVPCEKKVLRSIVVYEG